jgi:hypothetical protein
MVHAPLSVRQEINAAGCARKVIGNPKLNRSMDKTRSPRAGHQSHELDRRVGSSHWRLSTSLRAQDTASSVMAAIDLRSHAELRMPYQASEAT